MKEKAAAFFIILIFLAFAGFQISISGRTPVIGVITPEIIQVDLNNNHKVDDNETICAAGVKAFSSNLNKLSQEDAQKAGLTFEQAAAIGYLSDEFVSKLLLGNNVKLKFLDEKYADCRAAKIYINDKNYSEILYENGFDLKSPVFPAIKEHASKLNLVIYNHKSKKFHTLDCNYGKAAHDAVILLKKEIPSGAKPCKYCHVKKHSSAKANKSHKKYITEKISTTPTIITDGSTKLILTDFTTILNPDRNCSHSVCKEFVNLVNSSLSSIDIALYGWADIPQIAMALKNAEQRGVTVRIVYDTKTSSENYYPETDGFVKNFKNVRADKIEGNAAQTNMLMHNKFAIFDNQKVYTGSMNFSTTGFSGFNQNNVLIINSTQIAELYTKEFEQMYSGKFHSLKAKTVNNKDLDINGTKYSVFFSPQDKQISRNIVPLVKDAKEYIYIPAFLITHKALSDALIEAYERGIDVRLIVDATNTGTRNSTFKLLRTKGVPVKVENYAGKMHTKAMIIDNKYIVTGSANFSSSGENKNDENMLIIENQKLADFYRRFFLYIWQKIPERYLKYTVRAESKYSIGSCYDGIDNNFDGKVDAADAGCK